MAVGPGFAIVFRGYDKVQVDETVGRLEEALRDARRRVEEVDAANLRLKQERDRLDSRLRTVAASCTCGAAASALGG